MVQLCTYCARSHILGRFCAIIEGRFCKTMPRKPFPDSVETAVLVKCKRRCALCFGLDNDSAEKRGQIAHIEAPEDIDEKNAAFLGTRHHDLCDSTSWQTKGYTPAELRSHQETLLAFVRAIKEETKPEMASRQERPAGRGGLDVYDRRVPIYRTTRQFIRDVAENLRLDLKVTLQFATDTDEALFLFDDDLAEYLETLFKKALRLRTLGLMQRILDHPEEAQNFQALAQEETALTMSLLTPDTHFVVFMNAKDPMASQDLHSREALAPVFADLNKYNATTHFVGQSTIFTLTSDRVNGEAYCLAHQITVDGGKRRLMLASPRYLDTFVKLDGAWLFSERLLNLDWLEQRALS